MSKYASLPDLDSSQDIYETPDLADDTTIGARTTSPAFSDDDRHYRHHSTASATVLAESIDRTRLQPRTARGKFSTADVDASFVDFSDRVGRRSHGYVTSSRKGRRRRGGRKGSVEDSEDDGEETLGGRLARLRREVEELKVQVGEREEREERVRRERKAAAAVAAGEEGVVEGEEGIKTTVPEEAEEVDANEEGIDGKQLPPSTTTTFPPTSQSQPSYSITYAPTFHHSHSLARAADFDLRLTTLERLLGTTHSSTTHLSNLDKHLPANAIIPTLDDLARQISLLTSTNQPFVEALNRRVKMLTDQAEKLADARRSAARAAVLEDDDTHSPLTHNATHGSLGTIDTDRETKINALYGVLPTIQQLGPLLPSVLDRLRSLRAIHADAGRAAEGLEGIEKRQEEMSVEIGRWREALEKVEGVMKETEGVFMGNVGKVEELVRGLEERMEKVERLYSGDGEVV
ncbi:hypothetical protein L211DRAFT_820166 [Terfezia boudieri ATCC MYA-4762]|uniref:Dynamitin-domain-containing protein n=1 Tax=Terfezia boudieri ATCC MYA-4762 TaxID=1051890 RepID=A0A3N4LW52_9PEZI|nr:hypothetical protein L211DRAFT_820166 [Terfezia boudieri ATCC MYA-4762]